MTSLQIELLNLLSKILKDLPINANEEQIALAKKYGVAQFLNYLSMPKIVARGLRQDYAWGIIKESFELAKVDCLGLKGIEIKKYYPNPMMRSMSDIDLLYKEKQTRCMSDAMKRAGFECIKKALKHDYYHGNGVQVEMHREMVDADSEQFSYYKKIWEKAEHVEGYNHIFRLNINDSYIFLVVHTKEHIVRGEFNIKMLMDLEMLCRCGELDNVYIEQELNKIGLSKFEQSMRVISKAWFSGDVVEQLKEEFFDLSEYLLGNSHYSRNAYQAGRKTRIDYLVNALFPSFGRMCTLFGWLKKWPILLPIAWLIRFFTALAKRRDSMKSEWRVACHLNVQEGDSFHKMMSKYGI